MKKVSLLKKLFIDLRNTLLKENEDNWILGIDDIVDYMSLNYNGMNEKYIINEVRKKFQSMYGGMGSFSDYYIWRNDYEERVKENKKLSSTLDQIWHILQAES